MGGGVIFRIRDAIKQVRQGALAWLQATSGFLEAPTQTPHTPPPPAPAKSSILGCKRQCSLEGLEKGKEWSGVLQD